MTHSERLTVGLAGSHSAMIGREGPQNMFIRILIYMNAKGIETSSVKGLNSPKPCPVLAVGNGGMCSGDS